jgi:hypothetical protein
MTRAPALQLLHFEIVRLVKGELRVDLEPPPRPAILSDQLAQVAVAQAFDQGFALLGRHLLPLLGAPLADGIQQRPHPGVKKCGKPASAVK